MQYKKLLVKNYYDPLYFVVLEVVIGPVDEANAYFEQKKYGVKANDEAAGFTIRLVKDKKVKHLIWLLDHNSIYEVTHEIIHLCKSVFVGCGVPFTPENEEGIAYYQGFWLKKIWNDLGRINDQMITADKKMPLKELNKVKTFLKSGGKHD